MEASLLATKLLIPPERPGLVPRPRLMERMRGALNCSLTLVSAPAGFGKTTAVSQWARQIKEVCRIGWVSLDEADNDPVRFWDYLIAALQTLQPAIGQNALSVLHSAGTLPSQMPPIGSVLNPLINDLATFPADLAIVLDDYHLIESQQIHDGVTYLVEHVPPLAHLIISTRA